MNNSEFKQEFRSESQIEQSAQEKVDRLANFYCKVQKQFLEDPYASLLYFKDGYLNGRLDESYMNPPLDFNKELAIEPDQVSVVERNLLERFYLPEKNQYSQGNQEQKLNPF